MFFAIYPSGYLMGKDSHTPLMKRACSSVDTVARQVITTLLLATGAPDSVNYLLERERESLCGSECCSPKVGGHKYELSQQTEQKKLKEKIHKPPPFVAKPEYRAEKQHDRTQPRKDSTHDNLHDGAPPMGCPWLTG